MNTRFYLLTFLLLTGYFSFGQILPAPGDKLNYTQIMFEHPPVKGASEYLVEVALDSSGASFQHPASISKDSSTAALISHFRFGKKYSWRYTGLSNGKKLGWKGPYSFEILTDGSPDKNLHRVRVLQNDSSLSAGGLIVLGRLHSIFDRNGNIVWFLPEDTNDLKKGKKPLKTVETNKEPVVDLPIVGAGNTAEIGMGKDLRITPWGTITFLSGARAEEKDIKGHLIWKAPERSAYSPDSLNIGKPYNYHHRFKKLADGNYMVLDMAYVIKPASLFSEEIVGTDTGNVIIADEIIREFDPKGNLVWNWSSENYFDKWELRSMVQAKPDSTLRNRTPGGHMNAFDVDEKNGFVYAGLRNVSRVIKIDKKSGEVVCSWGDQGQYMGTENGAGFFSKQHGLTLLRDGSIALFNNNPDQINEDGGPPASSVVIFTQPTQNVTSKIVWKYECRLDTANNISKTGGNADELNNGNLLVCTGDLGRVFEITRNKQIVWSLIIEEQNQQDSLWHRLSAYSAHYASSLYPCYFTLQTSPDTLKKNQAAFQLRIFNDGTEADSYQIDISSTTGSYKKQLTTAFLPGRKSATFEIAPDKLPLTNDKIKVSVKSKTNPDFERFVYVEYNK